MADRKAKLYAELEVDPADPTIQKLFAQMREIVDLTGGPCSCNAQCPVCIVVELTSDTTATHGSALVVAEAPKAPLQLPKQPHTQSGKKD